MPDEKSPEQGMMAAVADILDGENDFVDDDLPPLLFADMGQSRTATGNITVEGRKAGRPPGSLNKSTEQWQRYFLSKFRSPLIVLGEMYSMPTKELARQLGCKPIEALKLQQAAAMGAAPFVHSKQPIAVDVTQTDQVVLTITETGSEPAIVGGVVNDDDVIEAEIVGEKDRDISGI